jgi:hypothetical protein
MGWIRKKRKKAAPPPATTAEGADRLLSEQAIPSAGVSGERRRELPDGTIEVISAMGRSILIPMKPRPADVRPGAPGWEALRDYLAGRRRRRWWGW